MSELAEVDQARVFTRVGSHKSEIVVPEVFEDRDAAVRTAALVEEQLREITPHPQRD